MKTPMTPGASAVDVTTAAMTSARTEPRWPVPYSSGQSAPSTMVAAPDVQPKRTMNTGAPPAPSTTESTTSPAAMGSR